MISFKQFISESDGWTKAVLRKPGSVKPGFWHDTHKKFVSDLSKTDVKGFDHERCKSINAQVEVGGKVVAGGIEKPLDEGTKTETEMSSPIKHEDLVKIIGKTRHTAMLKHPFYKDHVASGSTHQVFRHRINHLGDHEITAYGVNIHTDKNKDGKFEPKRMVRFDTYKNKVTNAHLFKRMGVHQSSDPKLNGQPMWEWIKSHKNEE